MSSLDGGLWGEAGCFYRHNERFTPREGRSVSRSNCLLEMDIVSISWFSSIETRLLMRFFGGKNGGGSPYQVQSRNNMFIWPLFSNSPGIYLKSAFIQKSSFCLKFILKLIPFADKICLNPCVMRKTNFLRKYDLRMEFVQGRYNWFDQTTPFYLCQWYKSQALLLSGLKKSDLN